MSDFFSGDSGKATTVQSVDPSQQRLNDLYFGELLGLRGATGGLSNFATPQPGLFSMLPSTSLIRDRTIDFGTSPGLSPQIGQSLLTQGNRLSDFAGEALDFSRQPVAGQTDLESINAIRALLGRSLTGPSDLENEALRAFEQRRLGTDASIQELLGFSRGTGIRPPDVAGIGEIGDLLQRARQGPSDLEAQSLQTLQGRTDPTALLRSLEQFMRDIVEPSARAASQAGGLGGAKSGALQEGLARESSRLALPIAELVNRNLGELGAAQERIGGDLEARRSGLAQALFNIGSVLEGREVTRRGFALPATEFGARVRGEEGQLMRAISEALEGRRGGLAGALFGTGADLERRSLERRRFGTDVAGRAGQLTADLGRLLPLMDQSTLARLNAAQQASDLPRLLSLQDFLRRQDLVSSALLRTPVKTGGITTEQKRDNLTLGNLIGPAATVAAASLLGS